MHIHHFLALSAKSYNDTDSKKSAHPKVSLTRPTATSEGRLKHMRLLLRKGINKKFKHLS
jgi:hypothetical protein